jgi:hypothetical protein
MDERVKSIYYFMLQTKNQASKYVPIYAMNIYLSAAREHDPGNLNRHIISRYALDMLL